MKTTLMALAAGMCALLLTGPAAAHVDVRVHAQVPRYYYPPAAMRPRYAPPPAYYVYSEPDWEARREMAWRRHQWHREHWRYHHRHHHYHHHHRHHHRHGWDGRNGWR